MKYNSPFVPIKRKRVSDARFLPGFIKRRLKAVFSQLVEWLREWIKPDTQGLVAGVVADVTHSKSELMLKNALLRQQLIVLERQVKRPKLSWRERGIMLLLSSKLRNCKDALFIVQPDTLLRSGQSLQICPTGLAPF